MRICRFLSTFRYHCVSEPRTGRRHSSPSTTNQTGTEIVRPDFLANTDLELAVAGEAVFEGVLRSCHGVPPPLNRDFHSAHRDFS
jgi:hypothetical protein